MPHIPRCIHQIWVGPNPVPEKSDTFIRDLKRLHSPRFEYRLWTDADVTPENFSNYNWIMKTSCYAQKADIMRYEILYNHGGVYFDTLRYSGQSSRCSPTTLSCAMRTSMSIK